MWELYEETGETWYLYQKKVRCHSCPVTMLSTIHNHEMTPL